ncbi:uncharacterized protein LOC134285991 [Aedes albopictus]|uniref:Integrase catalytic domain-containing protein n=1 Tax=Aedes albopictus TaxID=7160 RepID=A0ABM1YNV3_AEDAL
MLTPLPNVLAKFRERVVGFGGDIKEMFLQVRVRDTDKKARFVFRGSESEKMEVYIIDVTMFGATSSPCTAQYIKNRNAEEYAGQFPEAAEAIVENHYVDDYFDSTDTVEEAVKRRGSRDGCGFEIRNWVSNSGAFLEGIGERAPDQSVQILQNKESNLERVLGIVWNPVSDELSFLAKFREDLAPYFSGERRPTKRVVMSSVMSLFDPLGMLATFVIHGKMMIQDLWRSGSDWDQPIDDESCEKWDRWIARLPEIENVKIPRFYFQGSRSVDYNTVQLHVLVDASQDAYGAAAYFRVLTGNGPVCALVMARSKVAPLKMMSIPRLELQAAVIGARLLQTVVEAHSLEIKQRFIWLDSKTVVSWIHSEQRPAFLYQPEERWTKQEAVEPNTPEEVRACLLVHDSAPEEPMVDVSRISRWKVLVRTVACVYRITSNCDRRRRGLAIEAVPASPRRAEGYLWRSAQADAYEEEVKVLTKNRELPRSERQQIEKCSSLYSGSPFLDEEGILRMEGRAAQGSFLPFELRFPVILPKRHPITRKLLEYYHQQATHANAETVVNEVRQRFRIPNLRAELKAVMKACVWCRTKKCVPKIPRMAPLPLVCITPGWRPFSFTGVDYCGPVTVTVGRRSEKRWVCRFTCLTTRAVHLEVAHSLTTQACLMALRRFVCRRGKPVEFYSDNGTNFQGASKEIVRKIEGDCDEAFTDARTGWNFIPPSAPHMGGVWERLVRSVKAALTVLQDGRRLTDEVLLTTLAEAEDLVNSRPLTYAGLSPEASEALTPNHFVKGPEVAVERVPKTDEGEALRDLYKRSQALTDRLWKRWVAEYVPAINQRTRWHAEVQPISQGDLVHIADEGARKSWTRGVVSKVYPGPDERVRQALVKTAKGEFRRPVAKLAVLEIQERNSGAAGGSPQNYGEGVCTHHPASKTGQQRAPCCDD